MTDLLISSDAHMLEPMGLYEARLPKKLRDRGLKYEYLDTGYQTLFRAKDEVPSGMNFHNSFPAGALMSKWVMSWNPNDPNSDPVTQTLRDMDADGIWATLLHANNVSTSTFGPDHELALAHARVHNDYANEAYGAHRDRIVPTASIPLTDVKDAVAEIERVARMGFRGLTFPAAPPMPYDSAAYDPVWAAVQANGLVACIHVGTGFESGSGMMGGGGLTAAVNESGSHVRKLLDGDASADTAKRAIMQLIGGGVLERFPKLHFVFVEYSAWWLGALMDSMDHAVTLQIGQNRDFEFGCCEADGKLLSPLVKIFEPSWPYPLLPSEYARRQIHATFMHDPAAIATRHSTGIQCLMWSHDAPHGEGTNGHSREALDKQFAGVDASERAAIVGGTCAKLFNIKVPQKTAESRSVVMN